MYRNKAPPGPSHWSVDEVIQFMKEAASQTLALLVKLFGKLEINEESGVDRLMKYMRLKLRPALKLDQKLNGQQEHSVLSDCMYFSGVGLLK